MVGQWSQNLRNYSFQSKPKNALNRPATVSRKEMLQKFHCLLLVNCQMAFERQINQLVDNLRQFIA